MHRLGTVATALVPTMAVVLMHLNRVVPPIV